MPRVNPFELTDLVYEAFDDPEEREVTKHILSRFVFESGIQTYSDLLDVVSAAGPGGRRQLLDDARRSAGLKSATQMDEDREQARIARDDPARWHPPDRAAMRTAARSKNAPTRNAPPSVRPPRAHCDPHRNGDGGAIATAPRRREKTWSTGRGLASVTTRRAVSNWSSRPKPTRSSTRRGRGVPARSARRGGSRTSGSARRSKRSNSAGRSKPPRSTSPASG